uniref:Uncharacterized protein n=1 Tax=Eutreptiella gymnastica TaxID=73025 RepID=A0A7S4GAJ5_9EUGL
MTAPDGASLTSCAISTREQRSVIKCRCTTPFGGQFHCHTRKANHYWWAVNYQDSGTSRSHKNRCGPRTARGLLRRTHRRHEPLPRPATVRSPPSPPAVPVSIADKLSTHAECRHEQR